jgi:hypothetical protein
MVMVMVKTTFTAIVVGDDDLIATVGRGRFARRSARPLA